VLRDSEALKDPLGRPVARVTYDLHQNDKAQGTFMLTKVDQWLKEGGASETWVGLPPIAIAVKQPRLRNDPHGQRPSDRPSACLHRSTISVHP
jgi:hypothetical protein